MSLQYEPPTHPVDGRTLVFDSDRGRQVMFLDGVLPLPPGSVVELFRDRPTPVHGTATVVQVRLCNAVPGVVGAYVTLDCRVSEGWWAAYDR
jgi:hypothetical protein